MSLARDLLTVDERDTVYLPSIRLNGRLLKAEDRYVLCLIMPPKERS
jgi:hypothetical protein